MSDRDRPKRSWREIDAARDGGRRDGGSRPPSSATSSAQEKASRDHRATLDKLFEKGELGKYAEKLGIGTPGKASAPVAKADAPAHEPPKPAKPSPEETERATLRKKILEGTTREAVTRAFDRYVKVAGMPKDWELLERGLEHTRDERLAEVLTEIEALLARDKPRRTRTLDGRLRFIAETHEDEALRGRAAAVRTRLA
jgi:hypothetical protein